MDSKKEILSRIPQRPPFLYIQDILDRTENSVLTAMNFDEKLDFFQGHFPQQPLVPGVLLCEMAFQSGALLMSYLDNLPADQTAVVTRIQNAKFKRMVRPNDRVECQVHLKELIAPACFMKAKLTVNQQTCLQLDFSCATT